MIRLIINAQIYSPSYQGVKHLLLAGKHIIGIYDDIPSTSDYVEVYDADHHILVPGFVDSLVHYCGGGGEGGFGNRTPELPAKEAAKAGVTTLVGALGTDAITRTVSNLLGKCRELKDFGLSAYFYSGSYHLPLQTLTQTLETDLLFIPEIIGVGELALSDHRASVVTYNDLLDIARKTKTSASLAGKKGVVFCHLGDSAEQLSLLRNVVTNSDISHDHFIPTHCNRNPELFKDALEYGLEGGYIDFTTSTNQGLLDDGEVLSAQAVSIALSKGVHPSLITMSSDANASLPRFDSNGNTIGVDVGRIRSLYDSARQCHLQFNVPFEHAISSITLNPANALGLTNKGRIELGADADLVMIAPKTYEIERVWAKGQPVHCGL